MFNFVRFRESRAPVEKPRPMGIFIELPNYEKVFVPLDKNFLATPFGRLLRKIRLYWIYEVLVGKITYYNTIIDILGLRYFENFNLLLWLSIFFDRETQLAVLKVWKLLFCCCLLDVFKFISQYEYTFHALVWNDSYNSMIQIHTAVWFRFIQQYDSDSYSSMIQIHTAVWFRFI